MIEENINLIINEIQRQEKVTDESKPFLVVYVLHNSDYIYFCYYYKDENGLWQSVYDTFTNFLITDKNGNFVDKTKILRYLPKGSKIRFEWMGRNDLISLKRNTIQKQIDEARKSETDNNLKLITKELSVDCGKFVTFPHKENAPLLLICALSSDEDYYYLAMDKNFKIHYETCVGKYTLIDDNHRISEMKQWQKNNISMIRKTIEENFKDNYEVPFTDYSRIFKEL